MEDRERDSKWADGAGEADGEGTPSRVAEQGEVCLDTHGEEEEDEGNKGDTLEDVGAALGEEGGAEGGAAAEDGGAE